jgi:hypothetical protein
VEKVENNEERVSVASPRSLMPPETDTVLGDAELNVETVSRTTRDEVLVTVAASKPSAVKSRTKTSPTGVEGALRSTTEPLPVARVLTTGTLERNARLA